MDTTLPHLSLPSLLAQPPQPMVTEPVFFENAKNPLSKVLFNEILSHMNIDTLKKCSVVEKSWTEPCQLRLFESVGVGVGVSSGRFRSLQGYISKKRDALLPCARKLTWEGLFEEPEQIEPAEPSDLRDFLRIFTRLEHFQLKSSHIPFRPCELEPFSVFKDTLSCITLLDCHVSERALLAFTDYFTNLDHLYLSTPIRTVDIGSGGPSYSPRRLRKLTISPGVYIHLLDLLYGLSQLGLSFDEVVIRKNSWQLGCGWETFADNALDAIGADVKYLRLDSTLYHDSGNCLTLSPCLKLRELEFSLLWYKPLNDSGIDWISSITSMEIEKIRIDCTVDVPSIPWPWDCDSGWEQLDSILVELVGRPGYENELEVEFLLDRCFDPEEFFVRMDGYLPGFIGHEKGRATVRDWRNGPV